MTRMVLIDLVSSPEHPRLVTAFMIEYAFIKEFGVAREQLFRLPQNLLMSVLFIAMLPGAQ